MEVIDNFLPENDFKTIQEEMTSFGFPWYLNNAPVSINPQHLDDYQFNHGFFVDSTIWSNWFNMLDPIFKILKPAALIRVKANLRPRTEKIINGGWHVDYDYPGSKTCVFYINSNNGYTIFKETEEKVESVENRLLRFDSNTKHDGTTCTDASYRIVLNINYF
jgi:hypothetical protein